MARKHVSQQDVAEALNISRSTVAAILRNDTRFSFSEQTRRRVLETARRMNYQPHSSALSLRGGKTRTLVLATPQFQMLGGAIQSQNIRGMGEASQQLGYSLTLCSYGRVRQMKPTFEQMMRQSRFDGVLLHGDEACQEDPRERIVKAFGLPCVVLERRSEHVSWVDFDHQGGATMATRHLLTAGRRRLALVGAKHAQRRAGFLETLRQAGVEVPSAWVWPQLASEPYEQVARRAVDALFAPDVAVRPDGLLCMSDEIAASAIGALAERGLRVPEDVAVVGYDDSSLASYTTPLLTSVRQDGVEMGRQAVHLLVQQIQNPAARVDPVVLESTLTIRRSCGLSS